MAGRASNGGQPEEVPASYFADCMLYGAARGAERDRAPQCAVEGAFPSRWKQSGQKPGKSSGLWSCSLCTVAELSSRTASLVAIVQEGHLH